VRTPRDRSRSIEPKRPNYPDEDVATLASEAQMTSAAIQPAKVLQALGWAVCTADAATAGGQQ